MPGGAGKTASAVERALEITREAFRGADFLPVQAVKQNIGYSIYGLFHQQIALPRALGKPEKSDLKGGQGGRVVRQALPFIYSVVSLFWLSLRHRRRTAVWTGDFIDPNTRADFRLGKLYQVLNHRGVEFVEFIRTNQAGVAAFCKNAILRRRPVIYQDALTEILGWLFPGPVFPDTKNPKSRPYAVFRDELVRVARSIPILRAVYRLIGIQELIAWEYSNRQAGLIHAARANGIPVLGFMHGAGMQSYMAHEFISEYNGPDALGPDIFGVWSTWWKSYYEERSRIYGRIEVSGTLRKSRKIPDPGEAVPIRKVLWISEPLAEVEDVLPYLDALAGKFQLGIKKRPSTADSFYNALIEKRPEFRSLETFDGNIFEAMQGYDAVVGSHSTAVLDASWLNKPFLLVATRKWGDYFELGNWNRADWIYAKDCDALIKGLNKWEQSDFSGICSAIRERFYGDSERDGCEWVADTIQRLRRQRDLALDTGAEIQQARMGVV